MVDYGIVRSTVKPEEKVIDEFSVWVNTNISEIEMSHEYGVHTEFEYHQVQYSKDEYIKMIDEKNVALEAQVTDTQIALCDVYEMML